MGDLRILMNQQITTKLSRQCMQGVVRDFKCKCKFSTNIGFLSFVQVLFPSLVCNSPLCQSIKILCKACSQAQAEFGKGVKSRGITIQVHVSGLHADKKISLNFSFIQV